ncbi:MAG: glycosyltransferase [candidate division Zixibacteria bacterium]|nr:glycosyltransferase [candidate division Zixibacteria bacterium]
MSVYLSIVVPMYNEQDSVEKLLSGLLEVGKQFDFPYEIIFVDDGSEDKTWDSIERLKKKNPELRAIKLRRNYGQTSAMVAGFEHASGEIIVTMDGDLQNDPSDIPTLLQKIREGYDVASGWRINRRDDRVRVLPSRVANSIISWTTGVRLHDYGCSLKAYRAECIKSVEAYGEMHRFFPALARMTGARVTEVPVKHHPREYGVSKYGLDRILKVLSDIFAVNLIIRFCSNPLKGFVLCAIPFILLSLFFGSLGVLALIFQWTPGKALFFMISSALTGMAGVHLVALGVLGELVVGTSDLRHTRLPAITKRTIFVNEEEDKSQRERAKRSISRRVIAPSSSRRSGIVSQGRSRRTK